VLRGAATPIADADRYSVAGRSTLAFQAFSPDARLQWFDLTGNALGGIGGIASYYAPRISPDGTRLLVMMGDPEAPRHRDLFVLPLEGGVSSRMTFGPERKAWSVWSPDGKYIAYGRTGPSGGCTLVRKLSNGSGPEETLLTLGPGVLSSPVVDWSADGRYLSFDTFDVSRGFESNWVLPLFGEKKAFQPAPVAANQYDGTFSPDGHWLAYFSDESGAPEVYVVPFPGAGGKYQISHGGGWVPHWDRKGDLFFLSPGNRLMKAELALSTDSLQVRSLSELFQTDLLDASAPLYDINPDGTRALIVTPARAEASSIGLLLNWSELVRK